MGKTSAKKASVKSVMKDPKDKLSFEFLPEFASFILNNHLEDYSSEQLKTSRDEDVPLLKFFSQMPEEELLQLAEKSAKEFLTALAQNKARDYIVKSADDYIKNRISFLEREQVVAEDITIVSFIRRKTIRKFLLLYTKDFAHFIKVMEEVDRYIAENETATFNAYLQIQQEKLSATNAKLAQREQELLEAQELADMGSFLWDLEGGKNSTFTPGLMKIFEMTKTNNLESFMENVHEDDRESLRTAIEKSFHNDGIYECEYRFVKNNKIKKIWSRGKVSFRDGKPVNMKGSIMDVTKKDALLQQLKESEELHNQAQAITHIGNWSWDIESNKIEWSDEMYRIYGLEPQSEQITFERFLSLVHPDDREKRLNEIQESLQTLQAADYLMRITNPDGNIKILRGKGQVVVNKGKPVKLIGTCQDITKEHNLNLELQDKENYLKQLINNAPDAVIVIDEKSLITLWNPKTEEIFGWKAEEVTGKHLTETIIPSQYREAHKEGMKRLAETGVARILNKTLELTALNKEGKEFYISITISQSLQQGKRVFIAFLRDISIEKQTQDELKFKTNQLEELNTSLEYKNNELERMNKELESFNYIASHDLQEPLRKIQLYTNRIFEKGKNILPKAEMEYLDKINLSSARMKMLIEDLLTFSQTTSSTSNFEITDLNLLLEEVKNTLSAIIEDKKVIIESTPLPTIKVIPFQLQQVLLNLISNAIKYSKDGIPPHIKISFDIVKGEKIKTHGLFPYKNYVELKIEDNGIGFEENQSEKIFGLFQRLHSKDKYSGTGIGLAICKKMIQNHNGFIVAKSSLGVGSAFYVYLPNDTMVSNDRQLAN